MKRKIYDKLLEWKRTAAGRTALMIDGARRVGKSYIVEEFAKNEYESYLIIDFSTASAKVRRFFQEYLEDLDTFFMLLLSAYHVDLKPGKSLIVFDEVQRFPRAREAIKHLVADGRYHYIETGSLISINRNVRNILLPSEERHLQMFPMDFEEFLWATGHAAMMPVIEKSFRDLKSPGRDVHAQIMDVFRQYLVVGGMPQVVDLFAKTHDLAQVDAAKRDILSLYRGDILKFGGASKHRVAAIFKSLPAQLSRHEKKFVAAEVAPRAGMRTLAAAFDWLESSMVVNVCRAASEPNVGMSLNSDRNALKCYLGDTGLLVSMAFDERALAAEDIHNRILTDRIEMNKGMLVENVVAQMIRAAGHELYYYANSDREVAANRMEIDFLLEKPTLTRRHNIRPVEVKSGRSYSYTSLDKFCCKFSQMLDRPYILHVNELGESPEGVVQLPLYMTQLLVTATA